MLNHDQARRLANFCAHNNHKVFEIAQAFSSAFAPAFPRIVFMMPLQTKTQRFAFGTALAEIIKHAGNLDAVAPQLAVIGDRLQAAGFNSSHAPAAERALLSALRAQAGADFSRQIEQDWSAACAEVFNAFDLPAGTQNHAARNRTRVAA